MKGFRNQANTPIEPKSIFYHSDGTEINFPKMHFPLVKSIDFIPKHAKANESKITHYLSDGTGRDSYIIVNEGGQSNIFSEKYNPDEFFARNLRSYPRINSSQSNRTDFLTIAQKEKNVKEKQRSLSISKIQSKLIEKLAQPKKQFLPEKYLTKFSYNFHKKL